MYSFIDFGFCKKMRNKNRKILIFLLPIVFLFYSAAGSSKVDVVLFKEAGKYAAFPTLITGKNNELWVRFGWNSTGSHYGGLSAGEHGEGLLYTKNGGRSWLRKGVDNGYKDLDPLFEYSALPNGDKIAIYSNMHESIDLELAKNLLKKGVEVKYWPDGHATASYRMFLHRKHGDERITISEIPLTNPAVIASIPDKAMVMPHGTVLKAVYGKYKAGGLFGAWVLRSDDGGKSWRLSEVAFDATHNFSETALLSLGGDKILALIRSDSGNDLTSPLDAGFLWQSISNDRGETWSKPVKTEIWGLPPNLIRLKNGNILCTYGYRRVPYGIRAVLSSDNGKSWDVAHEIILRQDGSLSGKSIRPLNSSDLGYPKSVQLDNGEIITVYYITTADGITHIATTRWSIR